MASEISAPSQPCCPFGHNGIRLRPVTVADAPAVNAHGSLAEVV